MLDVQERIRRSIVIEKMQKNEEYCKKLGLENISQFQNKKIYGEEKEVC